MGNRVGVILHDNWKEFSPLLYSHYGADNLPFQLQNYLREYKDKYDLNSHSGHLYNPNHMMVGFIQYLDKDVHVRIKSLNNEVESRIYKNEEYSNAFEGGTWLVDISTTNYGKVSGDGDNGYILDNDNIVIDDFHKDDGYDWYL